MKKLLQEILDAGAVAELPLDMGTWHCGTACCLCGDVAVMRGNSDFALEAFHFSHELDDASCESFGEEEVARAIYDSEEIIRLECAYNSKIFTEEELRHPHLTTDHSDRAIAHDFVRLVMRKCDEVMRDE